jgi:hypothetical protein
VEQLAQKVADGRRRILYDILLKINGLHAIADAGTSDSRVRITPIPRLEVVFGSGNAVH